MILDAVEDFDKCARMFPLEKEKEEKKGLIIFFHVNGPILYRKVFRAIHHVEKDQPPMYRTIFVPRKGGPPYDATDGCPKCKG